LQHSEILRDLRLTGALLPTNDIWIAATAMEHGLILLTMDQHYRRIRQIAVSCFQPPAAP
jgi:predicted nucleic acid-binding protein